MFENNSTMVWLKQLFLSEVWKRWVRKTSVFGTQRQI